MEAAEGKGSTLLTWTRGGDTSWGVRASRELGLGYGDTGKHMRKVPQGCDSYTEAGGMMRGRRREKGFQAKRTASCGGMGGWLQLQVAGTRDVEQPHK